MSEVGLRVGPFEIVEEARAPEPGRWFVARRVGDGRREPSEVLVKCADASGHPGRAALGEEFERLRTLDDSRVPGPVGFFDGVAALAVARVDGLPLARLITEPEERRHALGLSTWLDLLVDVAATVQNAHGKGMVHGHLDPHHLWIASDGRLWLWGFGPGPNRDAATPWLPPERAHHLAPTAATDQWSLAALLAGILSGSPPWAGDDPAAQARGGDTEAWLAPITQRWPGLARALRKMLDPAPGHRFPTVQAARQELLAQLRLAEGVAERRALGAWSASLRGLVVPDDTEVDTADRPVLELNEDIDDEATMMVDPNQLRREIEALRLARSEEPAEPRNAAPPESPALDTWNEWDQPAADQERTMLFSDRDHPEALPPELAEHDTDMNKRLDEGLFAYDEEDSIARTLDRSEVPVTGPQEEPTGPGLPPLDLPIDDPTAERYQVPMYADDEDSGPYHVAIDIADIDTAPNASLHGVPSPLPLPPRPLSAPEKLASGLLAALALVVLVWFGVRVL